jgi:hypothetical protein
VDHNTYIGSTAGDEMCNLYIMFFTEPGKVSRRTLAYSKLSKIQCRGSRSSWIRIHFNRLDPDLMGDEDFSCSYDVLYVGLGVGISKLQFLSIPVPIFLVQL